jgi:uncharacterized sulfatase
LWRLHRAGSLPPQIEQYFSPPRPAEELYDLRSDPDTVRNVAADPARATVLRRMRASYANWIARLGDDSTMPEAAMIARIWPDMKQPVTAAPVITPRRAGNAYTIAIASPTPGASIGYRLGSDAAWQLYTAPIRVADPARIEAKSVRYGYSESPVVRGSAN